MKATGIVRRIDDLGRVVIPKEIRRTLRIREGDPLEIFTDQNGAVVLKKYSPIGELSTFAAQYAESMAAASGSLVCVTDRDHIIAAAGNGKKNYDGKPVSREMEQFIEARGCQVTGAQEKECPKLTLDDNMSYQTQALATIICEGDAIGAVALCSAEPKNQIGELQGKLAQAAAVFLAKQVEQ
ncbi:stage V sporulation protein T [uncultured Eubacterium sp.]|uniref:stage V sporulation protein T n=1 Tax=uncultured Eubacterium sp. TaxID=165185 RepID=UPI0025EE4B78|nr:stage V sporulation protein T [uncultured Eubacterium sp.]